MNKKRLLKKRVVILVIAALFLTLFGASLALHFNLKNAKILLTELSVKKVIYRKEPDGEKDYVLMETGDENQMDISAYQGCETVSLYNGLVYLNATQNKSAKDLLDELPKVPWGSDPNTGYAGDPFTADEDIPDGGYPTIWPVAMTAFAKKFAPGSENISGSDLTEIESQLLSGNPVELWVTIELAEPEITYTDYFGHLALINTHAVLLDGYDLENSQIHVTDPIKGKAWVSLDAIRRVYESTNQFAMVLKN